MESSLIASLQNVLKQVVLGSIIKDGQLSIEKFQKPRMRAQTSLETLPSIILDKNKGTMAPVMDVEFQHCAMVIAAAYFNPFLVDWDYERFSESTALKRETEKYFPHANMGFITKPTTVVDKHGRILLWYLPGLLLPYRVGEVNRVTKPLKKTLCDETKKSKKNESTSWRTNSSNFIDNGEESIYGAGKLSISIGTFMLGQSRLQDTIRVSQSIRIKPVQEWLEQIVPVEELLNAVLQIVHPEMSSANTRATSLLLKDLDIPLPAWPTVYPAMDLIANRVSQPHNDEGGANTFYDHLVCLGDGHDAKLTLKELQAEFAYGTGTSVLFPGKFFTHSVPMWSEGERLVIAHYSKDIVQDRLGIPRPLLPTQLGWWSNHSEST